MSSHFKSVKLNIPTELSEKISKEKLLAEDDDLNKVNLTVGAYRDENGDPWVLPVVRNVEKIMTADDTHEHEYLPFRGFEPFTSAAVSLLLGADNPAITAGRAFGIQVLSATGGLRTGAEFLSKNLGCDTFYCSSPTWDFQSHIFTNAGFKNYKTYRYWNPKTMSINFEGLIEDLKWAPEKSVIVLQGCGHNPTGMDPTHEQWKKIAVVLEERKLIPFFDLPYQGLVSGDLDQDAWVIRYFVKQGLELFCAQSFSKNFGLYNERVGNLTVVLNDSTCVPPVKSQLNWTANLNSSSPAHGVRIVNTILSNEHLYEEWKSNVKTMSKRIFEIRKLLRTELMKFYRSRRTIVVRLVTQNSLLSEYYIIDETLCILDSVRHILISLNAPGNWDHIIRQTGMYSYTGLTPQQVDYLRSKYHIYMSSSGRISVCGLNPSNVGYVAKAIFDAVKQYSVLEEQE